jgi:hypothetical protein
MEEDMEKGGGSKLERSYSKPNNQNNKEEKPNNETDKTVKEATSEDTSVTEDKE